MVTKKYWKKPIVEFVNLVRAEKKKKEVEILGTRFNVFPGVFSPVYSTDTAWFAEKLIPQLKKKRFLEIGCGAGVISCLAAINGARKVVATDINPTAVENTLINVKLHSLDISVREGSVFDPIKKEEVFDIIFWNHPFYCSETHEFNEEDDMLLNSVHDKEYRMLGNFFLNGKKHLSKTGRLLLGSSNVARISLIRKMAKKNGYKFSLMEKMIVPVYKGKAIKMDVRIYELQAVNIQK